MRTELRNTLGWGWIGKGLSFFEIFLRVTGNHVEIRLTLQPLRFIGDYCSKPSGDDDPMRRLRSSFAGSHYP